MSTRISTIFGVAVCALALSAPLAAQETKPGPGGKPSTSFDFKAETRKQLDAWQTLDPAKAAPFYSKEPDAVFYDLAPLVYHGWNEYAEGVKKMLADVKTLKLAERDFRVEQKGSLAFTTYLVKAEMTSKAGKTDTFDARCTAIWQKSGKGWVIEHEHLSAPMPEPAPAEKK